MDINNNNYTSCINLFNYGLVYPPYPYDYRIIGYNKNNLLNHLPLKNYPLNYNTWYSSVRQNSPAYYVHNSYHNLEDELISVIFHMKSQPLLQRFSLKKLERGNWNRDNLKEHPYYKQLQTEYRDAVMKMKEIAPELQLHNMFGMLFSGISARIKRNSVGKLAALPFVGSIEVDEKIQPLDGQAIENLKEIGALPRLMKPDGSPLDGEGVIVAIIDTGYNGIHTNRIKKSVNYMNGTMDIRFNSTHGTRVTDIVLDVAPKVSILAYKVMDKIDGKFQGVTSLIVEAITDAVLNKADIINICVGSGIRYEKHQGVVSKAVETAINSGIAIVMAAGNDNLSWGVVSPGNSPHVITVGAVARGQVYGNYGPVLGTNEIKPDVLAPGEYDSDIGTSYAAPYVSGAAALIKQLHSDWGPLEIKSVLATTALQMVENQAVISPSIQGSGIIQVDRAIKTETIISPIHISFGPIPQNKDVVFLSKPIRVHNKGGRQEYRVGYSWDHSNDNTQGIQLGISTQEFSLERSEEKDILLELRVDTNIQRLGGFYSGSIYIDSDDKLNHVPFLLLLEPLQHALVSQFQRVEFNMSFNGNFRNTDLLMEVSGPNMFKIEEYFPISLGDNMVNMINLLSPFVQGRVGAGCYTFSITALHMDTFTEQPLDQFKYCL